MRKTTALFLILLSTATFANAATQRHRIVNLPTAPQVTLSGQVVDLGDSSAVVQVEVAGGPNRFARTGSDGKFTLQMPQGIPVTLTFSRSGYETLTESITLSGAAARTFQLRAKPTARIVTTTGTTHIIDADSLEFGYAIPFLGVRHDPIAKMCRFGGQQFDLNRDDIQRVQGPALSTTQASCCTRGPMTGANFTLRSGEQVTAYFMDSCEHPHTQLFARNHKTWEQVIVDLSEVSEVVMP